MSVQLLMILIFCSVLLQLSTALWKLKSAEEDTVYAITLTDHNAAFSSSIYCVDSGPSGISTPNGLSRALCDACPVCIWKRRPGFSSELEWRRAVIDEMSRLEGVGVRAGGAGVDKDIRKREPRQEIVGTWIVETGPSLVTSVRSLATLAPSLGVSLDRLVVSEEGTRRFFVVSGKPTTVKRMLSAGFISATPIPPKLKVDPSLEVAAAAAERAATSTTTIATAAAASATLMACGSGGDTQWQQAKNTTIPPAPQDHLPWHEYAVHAALSSHHPTDPIPPEDSPHRFPPISPSAREPELELRHPPAPTPPHTQPQASSSSPPAPGSSPEPPVAVTPRRRPMQWAADWLHSSLGRNSTRVVSHTSTSVTAVALNKMTAYAAALRLAEHGDVVWVGPHAHITPSDQYASKLVQQWPPLSLYNHERFYQLPSGSSLNPVMLGTPAGAPPRPRQLPNDVDDHKLKGVLELDDSDGSYESSDESDAGSDDLDYWEIHPGILHKMGILGQGAVVAVADGAVDIYSCFFEDSTQETPKFKKKKGNSFLRNLDYSIYESPTHRKLRQYVVGHQYAYNDAGRSDRDFKHGTQVAGLLLGSPDNPNYSTHRGVAPDAKLAMYDMRTFTDPKRWGDAVVMRIWDVLTESAYSDDPEVILRHGYRAGARIQNLSWGAGSEKNSIQIGRPVDEFCFKHQDFIVLAAAGNDGVENPALSVATPASSKNVVAVGSHRNLVGDDDYYASFGRMDVVSDFSSRGPTPDGRIKPDLCGPGEPTVTSLPSNQHGEGSCEVGRAGGTSFATPVVAGVTVLVRQYFMEGYYPSGSKTDSGKSSPFVPMGALLKAVLVNSGRTLYQPAKDDTHLDRGYFKPKTLPTAVQGWGGVDVSTTLVTPVSPEGHALKVFGEWSKDCKACPKLDDGESIEYTFQVKNAVKGKEGEGSVPLKVTLVWYDYAAHNDARMVTINNLDLEVRPPRPSSAKKLKQPDTLLYPNGGDVPDKLNTVEHIEVGDPSVGTYRVRVKGTAVPMSPQPFALVISGPFDYDTVTEDAFFKNDKSMKKKKKHRRGKRDRRYRGDEEKNEEGGEEGRA